ncbi:MAG TPA: hydrolase TatD, partial [Patescibacteria group bacterium]|nr:hydrolase TatD [Patescibacteria group bacterium]
MAYIDIGANLTHESFAHDLSALLERARTASVQRIVVTGASRSGSVEAQQLAAAHPG